MCEKIDNGYWLVEKQVLNASIIEFWCTNIFLAGFSYKGKH